MNKKVKIAIVAAAIMIILPAMIFRTINRGEFIDYFLLVLELPIGLSFILIGNFLPKAERNRWIGIKIKWTLESDDNWNATHRLAGKVWVVGGLVIMVCAFLPVRASVIMLLIMPIITMIVPVVYSYRYYKVYGKSDSAPLTVSRNTKIVAIIAVAALLCFLVFMEFYGNVSVTFNDTSFTTSGTFAGSVMVDYDSIESVEYVEDGVKSSIRTFGVGSFRLNAGNFRNDELGNYFRYTYNSCESVVIIRTSDKSIVVNGKNEALMQSPSRVPRLSKLFY